MDITEWKPILAEGIKKYRYVVLVLLAGIVLMLLPTSDAQQITPEKNESQQPELQDSLAEILSLIQGAGKVKVLLTEKSGEQSLYQTNETDSTDTHRVDTVLISSPSRDETGLIVQVNAPVYRGAVVLCQGADNANIRLAIVEAVKSVTGLTSDHITVLKMK